MAHMEARMTAAADRFSPEALLRSWMSLVPQTPEQLEVVGRFFRSPVQGGPEKV